MKSFVGVFMFIGAALTVTDCRAQISVTNLWSGIYQSTESRVIAEPTSPTKEIHIDLDAKLIERTTKINAALGTTFGIAYEVQGLSSQEFIPIKVMWHFPEIGLQLPDSAESQRRFVYESRCPIRKQCTAGYTFEYKWELVPGKWIIEVWSGAQKLTSQVFEVRVEP